MDGVEEELYRYGADVVHIAMTSALPLPHIAAYIHSNRHFSGRKTANSFIWRNYIGARFSSPCFIGFKKRIDCRLYQLEIGDHSDNKGNEYKKTVIPNSSCFGGNIIATIINPDHRPAKATVREGVMRKEVCAGAGKGELKKIDIAKYLNDTDFVVEIIERHIEERKIDIKGAPIIVSGGYGVGSKEKL